MGIYKYILKMVIYYYILKMGIYNYILKIVVTDLKSIEIVLFEGEIK